MPNWIFALLGAIPTALVAWLLHTVDVDRLEAKHRTALSALATEDKRICDGNKQLTKEANDAIQKDRDAIAARYAKLVQQHPAACVPVSGSTKLSTSGDAGHAGQNGIGSDWLRSYAAECEGYRREVSTCIFFVNQLPK